MLEPQARFAICPRCREKAIPFQRTICLKCEELDLEKDTRLCSKCTGYFQSPVCGRCGPEVQTFSLDQFMDPEMAGVISIEYSSLIRLEASLIPSPNAPRQETIMLGASPRRKARWELGNLAAGPLSSLQFFCDRWGQFKIFGVKAEDEEFFPGVITQDKIQMEQVYQKKIEAQQRIEKPISELDPLMSLMFQQKSNFPVERPRYTEEFFTPWTSKAPPQAAAPKPKLPGIVEINPRRKITFEEES